MKNKELFDRTISILVKAYQQETLVHMNCCACAVGNIVAANCGISYIPTCTSDKEYKIVYLHHSGIYNPRLPSWFEVCEEENYGNYSKECILQIESTGYTVKQIQKIERAFEAANYKESFDCDEDGFKGLMNVVDCLMKIHESTPEQAAEAKQLFVKEAVL